MSTTDEQTVLDDLAGQLDGDLLCDRLSRAIYSTSACLYQLRPLAIVQPRTIDDLLRTVRACAQAGIPITGRGGGSGLVGQAIGTGMIVDFSRYLYAIGDIDAAAQTVQVEPGVPLGNLQAALKKHGLLFPPDPSSGNYCTLGGMISTNASGAHSIKYGATIDYIEQLDVILADGQQVSFREYALDSDEYRALEASDTTQGRLHRGVRQIVERYAGQIERFTPRAPKNSSGYRLDRAILDGRIHLGRLLAASEGTLALICGATLRTLPVPTAQQMAVLWFRDLPSAAQAVERIVPTGPAALEILDDAGMTLIRKHHPELGRFLPEQAKYVLFTKYDGTDADAVRQQNEAVCADIVENAKLAAGSVVPADAAEQEQLWAVRKALLPILYALPGPGKILGFIEDVSVPPGRIVEFVEGLSAILSSHDTRFVVYGHAGQGNFHVRPVLNTRDREDLAKMRSIADQTFELVAKLGGAISGEHGDGLARTPYLEKMYGDLYPAFMEIKQLFDPGDLFNPGRIVNGSADGLTSDLRAGPDYQPHEEPTELHFEPGERLAQIEACQGCGACRTILPVTTMCPVYKALRDETVSPRAKANVLQQIIAGRLSVGEAAGAYKRILEMCIGCGSCRRECPSNVDIPKLMLDAKTAWARRHGRSIDEWLLSHAERLAKINQGFRAIANPLMRTRASRRLMEAATGIDARRTMPPVNGPAEPRLLLEGAAQPQASVVYLADIYARYNDPSIAVAAVEVLEHNGVEVIQPPLRAAGVPAMIYGDSKSARRDAQYNIDLLAEHVEAGRVIVSTEPTATLALRERYADYVPTEAARQVAQNTRDLFDFLRERLQAGLLRVPETELAAKAAYHTPCHVKCLENGRPAVDVLGIVRQLTVEAIDEGCCGMAGTFGMRRKYYDLSMKIGRGLFERLRTGGFDFATTDCSTCAMQIREGTELDVHHPIKLLWAAYGLGTL